MTLPIKKNSILFAPLEGYTDPLFREVVSECFPEWDLQYTDFLRLPSQQLFRPQHIREHIGENFLEIKSTFKTRNILQILSPAHAPIEEHAQMIWELGQTWLDFNLGCPSKKVNGHKGGSYLLQDLVELQVVLKKLRRSFPGTLTVKVRTGYNDTNNFNQIISSIADCGIDAITVHARTRAQQYNGPADWSFIKRAVELVSIPIIGNGDIWDEQAAKKLLNESGCYAVMAARGALKTPWMARRFKRDITEDSRTALAERDQLLPQFMSCLYQKLILSGWEETSILKRLKSVARFMFDDYPDAQVRKSAFLRCQSLKELQEFWSTYFPNTEFFVATNSESSNHII